MKKFNLSEFADYKILETNKVSGGGETGGGYKETSTSAGNFFYDSDYSTWSSGSSSWKVSYYGIRSCECPQK